MGWERDLFAYLDDLEAQAEGAYARERAPEIADRTRAEYQRVTLSSRLMASVGDELVLDVQGPGPVAGRLDRVGTGWCLLSGTAQDWLVRLDAVSAVRGASPRAVPEVAWSPRTRLGLGAPLRRLADEGERCVLHLRDGDRHDGVPVRVGQDFVEVVEGGEAGRHVTLIAFAALAAVQSR